MIHQNNMNENLIINGSEQRLDAPVPVNHLIGFC